MNSKAAKKDEEDTIKYREKAAEEKNDSEVDDIEDKEAEEALRWLELEWESLAKILMKTDSETHWNEVCYVAMSKNDHSHSRLDGLPIE